MIGNAFAGSVRRKDARDPLGFVRGRLFDFVDASLRRSIHYAQDDRSIKDRLAGGALVGGDPDALGGGAT